jgi:hypothetical protein
MWGLLGRKSNKGRKPFAAKACRITWRYEHPAEVLAFAREADTRDFATWLPTVADCEAITRRQLVSLYAEFCEIFHGRPMTWGRFDRSLKGGGFQRYRSSAPGRPWLYRVVRPGSALVYKLPPQQVPLRRAA